MPHDRAHRVAAAPVIDDAPGSVRRMLPVVGALLDLQRAAGNHAVVQRVRGGRQNKQEGKKDPPRRSARLAKDRLEKVDVELADDQDEEEILAKSRLVEELQRGPHVDFKGNRRVTRGQEKKLKQLAEVGKFTVEEVREVQSRTEAAKPPTRLATGVRLFVGNRGFRPAFADQFWTLHPLPVNCGECGQPIAANGRGDDGPSIDHITPWSTLRLGLDTITVCKGGTHWEVVLQRTVDEANEQLDNLRPVHRNCNSAKGGTKGNDDIVPTRLRQRCSGDDCACSKAE